MTIARTRYWSCVSGIVAVVAASGGYLLAEQSPAAIVVHHAQQELTAIRRFCEGYYRWREGQPRSEWIDELDQTCFDAREMVP